MQNRLKPSPKSPQISGMSSSRCASSSDIITTLNGPHLRQVKTQTQAFGQAFIADEGVSAFFFMFLRSYSKGNNAFKCEIGQQLCGNEQTSWRRSASGSGVLWT